MALRKIELMHRKFGKCEGHTCRECSNLIHTRAGDRPLAKCKVYGETSSEASDWTQRWQACGMFNKQWDKGPVIRLVRPVKTKKEDAQRVPLDGQISMQMVPVLGKKTTIFKEDLLNTVLDHFGIDLAYLGKDLQFCQEAIDMAPAVDPVHAAGGCYCEECKHWEEVTTVYGKDMVCTNQGCMKVAKRPNDFCSIGERREGE